MRIDEFSGATDIDSIFSSTEKTRFLLFGFDIDITAEISIEVFMVQVAVNEIDYITEYIKSNIVKYKLSELTNNNMGDLPNVVGAHPLALEYGEMISSEDPKNYTSILPAIGIELTDENDYAPQYMGTGYKVEEVSQSFIDTAKSVSMKNRFSKGMLLSGTNLDLIQTAKTLKGSEKLYAKTNTYLNEQSLVVSVWSDNWKLTRILFVAMRSIMNKLRRELSKEGAKNVSLHSQAALYNYEFNKTLFGGEFNLRFVNSHKDSTIDNSIGTIKRVDESIYGEEGKSKPTFKGKGESDE